MSLAVRRVIYSPEQRRGAGGKLSKNAPAIKAESWKGKSKRKGKKK